MEVLIVNYNLDTKAEMKNSATFVFENIQSLIAVLRVNKTHTEFLFCIVQRFLQCFLLRASLLGTTNR